MSGHELWHITVLSTTLLALAGAGIVWLAPLIFGSPPKGVRKVFPAVVVLSGLAITMVLLEWLVVHGG